MPSTDIIKERLKKYRIAKEKNKDINCITSDLYDRAITKYRIMILIFKGDPKVIDVEIVESRIPASIK